MPKSLTYSDKAIKESLLDVITNIDPTDYQLYTGLAKSTAGQPLHSWVTDKLKNVEENARTEGFDATFANRVDPDRKSNLTQIISVEFDVSESERSSNQVGFEDRYAREMDKAMKEWKNDAEFALMRGVGATGSAGVARKMTGLKSAITSNLVNASGTALTETLLNDYLQLADDKGGKIDEIYVPMKLKRKISGFTAGSTKFTEVDDKRLINKVDVYESDMGVHKLFRHRWINQAGDTGLDLVGIQSDAFSVAHLTGREPKHVELAKTGDSTKGMIVGELTLEFRAEHSSVRATNLTA